VIVAALVVAALGLGLRQYGAAEPTSSPDTSWIQLTYRIGAAGTTPAAADVKATAEIMQGRLMGGDGTAAVAGHDVVVVVPGSTDVASLRSMLEDPGRPIEFVLLPPASYGTVTAAGQTQLPKVGDAIDASLPAQFHGTQIRSSGVLMALPAVPLAPSDSPGVFGATSISVGFIPSATSALNAWAAQHAGDYVAVVVEGKVASITSVPQQVSSRYDFSFTVGQDLTQDQLTTLAGILAVGELPLPVQLVDERPTAAPSGWVAPTPGVTVPPTGAAPSGTSPGISAGAGAYTQGSATTAVTLDVWLDYQCANCAVFDREILPQIVSKYVSTGEIRIFFFDFDVEDSATGGHESLDAANAARCAADLGKYETYRDVLFASQGEPGSGAFATDRLLALGDQAGVDMTAFQACANAGSHDADVRADTTAAMAAGLTGVPAVAVNGQPLPTYDYATISQAIEVALKP
jgi:protein-disulfide isomerase